MRGNANLHVYTCKNNECKFSSVFVVRQDSKVQMTRYFCERCGITQSLTSFEFGISKQVKCCECEKSDWLVRCTGCSSDIRVDVRIS